MARELTASVALTLQKGIVEVSWIQHGVKVTVSGSKYTHIVQAIGTSATALDIGDITTPGYILMKNQDATNYVTIRMGASGADVVKMKAGEIALFRLAGSTPYAVANTASVNVEYFLIED